MKLCYYTAMKRFAYAYLVLVPLLFALFYWDISPLAEYVNHYQTQLTLFFLERGLEEGQLKGIDIMINPHYKIIITKACNGMIPILVLWAAILAYPIDWMHKMWWVVIGYVILTAINIARLLMVSHFVKDQPDFPLYHDFYGNLLLMVAGLALFYLFLRSTRAYARFT